MDKKKEESKNFRVIRDRKGLKEKESGARHAISMADIQGGKDRQNGRKMTSFRGATAKLAAWVGRELGGSAPHQCR